jgi:hypothetical protein
MTPSRNRALPRAAAAFAALAFLLGVLLPAAPGAVAPVSQARTAPSAFSADSARPDPAGWVRADRADEPLATPAPRPGRTSYPVVPAVLVAGLLVAVSVARVVRGRRRTLAVRRGVEPRAPRAPPVTTMAAGLPA